MVRRRNPSKRVPPQTPSEPSTRNSFKALQTPSENPTIPSDPLTNPSIPVPVTGSPDPTPSTPGSTQIPLPKTSIHENLGPEIGDPNIDLEDQELTRIDMAHLEQAYRK